MSKLSLDDIAALQWEVQRYENDERETPLCLVVDAFDNPIAEDMVEEFAHIMAAAPDLVKALREARQILVETEQYWEWHPVVKMCDAALARVTQ